jgi:hypothetical protein
VPDNPEACLFPGVNEQIGTVPRVETDHQAVLFQHAVHLLAGRLQPFRRVIAGERAA